MGAFDFDGSDDGCEDGINDGSEESWSLLLLSDSSVDTSMSSSPLYRRVLSASASASNKVSRSPMTPPKSSNLSSSSGMILYS